MNDPDARPCPTSAQAIALLGTARTRPAGLAISRDWGIPFREAVEIALAQHEVTLAEIVYEPSYAMHLIFDGYEETAAEIARDAESEGA